MDAPYAGVLGGYRLFGPIAVDGAGQVFAAEPPGGGRVLVRVLAAAPASFAEFDARARALEQLVHPGLVPVLAHGAEGGRAWIATAQTEADPLRAPRLPDHQVLALAAGLADALDYAHAHGQVHGDLGPGAVLLSRIHAPGTPGSVVITGLGVLGLTGRLTPNPLAGGPDCCAPEVLAASAATPAADQYALACLLYRLLTGTPVFPGGSHQQVADGHLQQSPAPISSRRPEPAGLDPVFARALAKDPEQRHPSCRVFVDALAAVLAPPPAAPPGPSNPTLVPSPAPSSPGAEAATAPAGQDAPSRPDPGAPAAGGNGSGDGGPDSPTDGAPRRRRKLALIGALVVLVLAIAGTVVGILATGGDEPLDQTTASTLSTDGSTTCAVRDGQAYCWGANESGQVGDGTTEQRTTPVKVPGLGTVSSIVVGGGTVCAIADEQLYCWGANESGKVGDGTTEPVGKPARVGDLQRVSSVTTGINSYLTGDDILTEGTTCAVAEGTAYCWGSNSHGQLGDGTTDDRSTPVQVKQSGITALTTEGAQTCALTGSGDVYCWGDMRSAPDVQTGSFADRTTPAEVAGVSEATAVMTAVGTNCAISDGRLLCWGNNSFGQLGDGSRAASPTPRRVEDLSGVTSVASGSQTICAVADAQLYCWGSNGSFGGLFDDPRGYLTTPKKFDGVSGEVRAVTVRASTVCAETTEKTYCWGENDHGQLGIGTTEFTSNPSEVTF